MEPELADLTAKSGAVSVPPEIDMEWPPARLNAVLRSLWREIRLDDQLRPVMAEWIVPEWRA